MKPYIDIRGPWPTLVSGQAAFTMNGCDNRNITVEEAQVFILLGSRVRPEAIATDLDVPFTTE